MNYVVNEWISVDSDGIYSIKKNAPHEFKREFNYLRKKHIYMQKCNVPIIGFFINKYRKNILNQSDLFEEFVHYGPHKKE